MMWLQRLYSYFFGFGGIKFPLSCMRGPNCRVCFILSCSKRTRTVKKGEVYYCQTQDKRTQTQTRTQTTCTNQAQCITSHTSIHRNVHAPVLAISKLFACTPYCVGDMGPPFTPRTIIIPLLAETLSHHQSSAEQDAGESCFVCKGLARARKVPVSTPQ